MNNENCSVCEYWSIVAKVFGCWRPRFVPIIAKHMRDEHEPACS